MLFEVVFFGLCVALFVIHLLCSCKYYYEKNAQKEDKSLVQNLMLMTMDDTVIAIVLVTVFCFSFLVFCCKAYSRNKAAGERERRTRRVRRVQPNQQEDIFNISSRVQGQGQGPWPTHDNHVSLDNFVITSEINNKYNDAPPTYEEAMSIAASNNNNAVVPAVVPKTPTAPTSTSTSAVQ